MASAESLGPSEILIHFELKYQLITDNVKRDCVKVHYVPSVEMVADVFTKNLAGTRFAEMKVLLGMEQVMIHGSRGSGASMCMDEMVNESH